MPESAIYVLEKMSHGFRRFGKPAGAGFYDYPAQGEATLWSGLRVFERGGDPISPATVADRLKLAIVREALRGLADGTVPSRSALLDNAFLPADFGRWLDAASDPKTIARAHALEQAFGPRFSAPSKAR